MVNAARDRRANHIEVEASKPIKPKWAALISQIFGTIPIQCSKCGTNMELKEFILEEDLIRKQFSEIARAPPRKTFKQNPVTEDDVVYVAVETGICNVTEYNQTREETDAWYDQTVNW